MKRLLKNICNAALAEELHAVKKLLPDLEVVLAAEDRAVVVADNQLGYFVRTSAVEVRVQKFQTVVGAVVVRINAINQEHVALAD